MLGEDPMVLEAEVVRSGSSSTTTSTTATTATTSDTVGSNIESKCAATPTDDVDEWGFNEPSPWSRSVTGSRSRSSFSELETPPPKSENHLVPLVVRKATSDTSPSSTPTPTLTPTPTPTTNHHDPKKKRKKRNHRRRMSALADSHHHLLDDSIAEVVGSQRNPTSTTTTTTTSRGGGGVTNRGVTPSSPIVAAGDLSSLLRQAPPNIDVEDAAQQRIIRIRQQISDAVEFVSCLPSVSFDVIKVNKMGRRQRRVRDCFFSSFFGGLSYYLYVKVDLNFETFFSPFFSVFLFLCC